MPKNKRQNELTTISQRLDAGKALREKAPLKSHGDWKPAKKRPDPITLLQKQDVGRVQRLVPIKYGRMAESPFAFLRGSAGVMAADLVGTPSSDLEVQLCGDAHLSNFGVFATPERNLVFDINDFDETHQGPWEWDLKRLAASAVVAGRDNGYGEKTNRLMVVGLVRTYADAMATLARAHTLDVWYYHVEVDAVEAAFKRAS